MSLLRNAQCAHKLLSQKWSRENMLLARQATLGKEVIDKLCKAEKNNEQILNKGSNDNWGLCCGMYDYRKASKEFDRWRMREFHIKQKIDEATVKKTCKFLLERSGCLFLGGAPVVTVYHLLLAFTLDQAEELVSKLLHCGFVSIFHSFFFICLKHITPLNTCPPVQNFQTRIPGSMFLRVKYLPPSVTVVPLTFTFTLLCQCKCCCQCCLRALPRSRSTSAGHQHASRGYSRHFQSKFEVLFTERQSQSCIQNQLNMMRNGLDWNLMEIPFHSDSDWRES